MTTDYLYRFRPIHAVLDGFHELENQEIYFSELNNLNDPMEGFRNIYWKGDTIVWRNFFQHYLLNLLQSIIAMCIDGENFHIDICNHFIFFTDEDFKETKVKDIYENICNNFLKKNTIKNLIVFLSSIERKIKREELSCYLQNIHLFAISTILNELEKHDIKLVKDIDQFHSQAISQIKAIDKIMHLSKQSSLLINDIFFPLSLIGSELKIIYEFNNPIVKKKGWYFILRNFINNYITALEQILYPKYYISCFVSNPTDASMWGTYGDSHKGVSLKFKTLKKHNKLSLNLDTPNEIYRHQNKNDTSCDNRTYYCEKVQYSGKFPEIDFFSSIGNLSTSKLDYFWYRSKDGKISSKKQEILDNIDDWRQKYWDKFSTNYKIKLPEWQHEQEYRLVLPSGMCDFTKKESRKLKYQFSDLSGIIFGIRTSDEDKIRIIKIIKDKCSKEKRDDFEFFQTYYSTRTKKIELYKLSLIKFS